MGKHGVAIAVSFTLVLLATTGSSGHLFAVGCLACAQESQGGCGCTGACGGNFTCKICCLRQKINTIKDNIDQYYPARTVIFHEIDRTYEQCTNACFCRFNETLCA